MSSPLPIDPYEVLNVARDADAATIRTAYRKLALKHHPDRIKDEALRKKGTEEFQKTQQAYELLNDDKRRARYDDQIRLAQLKKDVMTDRAAPPRTTSYPPQPNTGVPRSAASTTYEYGRVFEERKPTRYSDDDDRYAEPPRSTRRPAYERRPATSYPEEKKKKSEKPSSMFGSFVDSKLREKAREAKERSARTEAAKARDKDRRRDSADKYRRTAYVEEDSSSDSDTYVPRRPEPPRRSRTYYEEPPRRRQESPPRRRQAPPPPSASSSDSDSDHDSYKDEWARRHNDAKNYISERSAGRPSVLRTDSAKYYAISADKGAGRRSGSDKDERRDDRRDDRPKTSKVSKPEVVEPPRRTPQSRKAPPMTSTKSSPAGLKSMTRDARDIRDAAQPQRSATGDYPTDHKRPTPTMKRSETMPVPTSRKEPPSSRSSRLKHSEVHDSGYGSSGQNTPEVHSGSPPKNSKTTTSKFFIVEEDPEHSRGSYRTVPVNDNYTTRRARSPSPAPRDHHREGGRDRDDRRERDDRRDKEDRRDRDKDKDRKRPERSERPERPTVQTNASYSTARSTPYTISPEQLSSRPQPFRTDSSRSTAQRDAPALSRGDSGRSYSFKPDNVRYSPQLNPENLNKYARNRHASDLRDRDYYPGSNHHDNIHTPKTGRRESIY